MRATRILCILLSIRINCSIVNNAIQRVAFLFSGSARSFIYPIVHESIRINLIASLCPQHSCIPDIFIRISATDNTHLLRGTQSMGIKDSRGIFIQANELEIQKIKYAIKRLLLNINNHSSHIDIRYIDINSTMEYNEMISMKPSVEHRLFRDLDPRRYSMYFGRWHTYKLASSYELQMNIQYNWFVHARLDMAYASPLKSSIYWNISKIHVPDTWLVNVPDTFAIIPSKYAQQYYDIDLMFKPNILCFGGPNFDMKTIEIDYLANKGYTSSEIQFIRDRICSSDVFGWSEQILMRKLKYYGISSEDGTLQYDTIFGIIIRMISTECQLLHPENQIMRLWGKQPANMALIATCSFIIDDAKNCQNTMFSTIPSTNNRLCPLSKEISDWNFLPFRIRVSMSAGGGCITSHYGDLIIAPCIDEEKVNIRPNMIATYSLKQLFYFYPLYRRNQIIRSSEKKLCLAIKEKLTLKDCNNSPQKFTINLIARKRRIKTYKQNTSGDDKNSVVPILRRRELVIFKRRGYCMHFHNNTTRNVLSIYSEKCKGKVSRGSLNPQLFIIERTSL